MARKSNTRRILKRTVTKRPSKRKTTKRRKKRKTTKKMRGGSKIPLKLVYNIPYKLNTYSGLDVARSLKGGKRTKRRKHKSRKMRGGFNPLTDLTRSLDFNIRQLYNNYIGQETLPRENPYTVSQ
jgi:hypothetical protein